MHPIEIDPFTIQISESEVARLKRKLVDTRLPEHEIVAGAGDAYGTKHVYVKKAIIILSVLIRNCLGPPAEWFQRLYNKWVNDFDWFVVQKHLNRHQHAIATIPDNEYDLKIHFTHTRSMRTDAIPIILIHGWPGSFYEFDRLVDNLAAPQSESDPAFHVVVPSLPGFCWSSNPPKRGWTMQDNGRLFDKLMAGLGYDSYVVQAGDWGSFVARELGSKYPRCRAIHLNFSPATEDFMPESESEKKRHKRSQDWLDDHLGYAVCMRTRPHTVGYGFHDNPMGILSWVGEKYYELVSPARRSDPAWDKIILTQVSLYYFSGCIMPSMLPYYENPKHAEFAKLFMIEENLVKVPMAYTSFLYDSRPGNKRSAKLTGNLVFYNGMSIALDRTFSE